MAAENLGLGPYLITNPLRLDIGIGFNLHIIRSSCT